MEKEYNEELDSSFDIAPKDILPCYFISDVDVKKAEWIWKERIPKGTLTIVEGEGGRGKSTIAVDICARLSTGVLLPDDDTQRNPMKILILSREDDPSIVLRPRLETHKADLKKIMFSNQDFLLNEEGLKKLENAIRQEKFDLIVIDPIVSFIGNKIDMNKSSDVRSMLAPLVDICRDYDCTILIIRHFNKMQNCSSSNKGAGSADFRNCARSVLQVLQKDTDKSLYLVPEKSNYGKLSKALPFAINDSKVCWGDPIDLNYDEIDSNFNKSALDEAIIFLKTELIKPVSAKEILRLARNAGVSERTLRRASYKIGVIKKRLSDYWEWSLINEDKEDGQDDQ